MSDVFILGAGFSKAISTEMPITMELANKILTDYKFKHPIPASIQKMIREDFEKALTFLCQDKPWVAESENLRHKATFLDLATAIQQVIRGKSRSSLVLSTNKPPTWLDLLLAYWHNNRCAIITLNYDTLIERTASSIYGANRPAISTSSLYPIRLTPAVHLREDTLQIDRIQNEEPMETFKLFKLHGSINWFYSGGSTFWGEELFYVPCEGGLDRVFDIGAGKDTDKEDLRRLSGKCPLIIPPTLYKSAFFQHEALRSMWFQAGEAIKQASRVICMGFSLPESDLTMAQFLKSCAPKKRIEFEIVDLAKRSKVDHFVRIIGKDVYDFHHAYSGAKCIPKFVARNLINDLDDKRRVVWELSRSRH
jgi:hypothetical protein